MHITKRRIALATMLASVAVIASPALAQDQAPAETRPAIDDSDDIIVTAQKREENLQNVPISIQALGTKKLDQLNISNFAEFSQLLPSVSFQSSQPGLTTVYMRGVASGGDGNHSGSLPSVGVYLDEQPVTTIGGTLDVHVYDIARIESLSGPQGTLYGASSQAGTIRIITNKPDTTGFSGAVDAEVNTVKGGGVGGKVEGFINAPLSDMAALRVVGFYQRDAGYIDNVAGTRSFNVSAPSAPLAAGYTGTVNNSAFVKKNFNTNEVYGGRAALKVDLDDNWTVTPTVIYQQQKTKGIFGYDKSVGDLKVQRFAPDTRKERFVQAALTIEGKVGNWDVTYAGAYLDRTAAQQSDYTDYAEIYDTFYTNGLAGDLYFTNAAGRVIDPRQFVVSTDHFKKMSQEFRVASPQEDRFRIVAGLFYQRQSNLIHQDYQIANLAPAMSVNGYAGTLWLTQQHRVDKDYAMFGEASFDILPNLTLTGGGRAFIYDNSLIGFYGFGRNPAGEPYNGVGSSGTGVAACFTASGSTVRNDPTGTVLPPVVAGGPCTNLGVYLGNGVIAPKKASGQGFTHRLNLTWKATDDLLFYGTWSRGFRPGGINRQGTLPPYEPDYLTNYEIGFKTTLLDGALRFNGAFYLQDWKAFQFSFLGLNSLTQIQNGSNARIKGVEADINLQPISGLTITASGAYTDAKTRQNICNAADPTFACTGPGNFILTPGGTTLPITPKFKINGTARYTIPVGSAKVHFQGLIAHQSSASSDVRVIPAAALGRLQGYTTGDFAIGAEFDKFSIEAFVQNAWDERAELSRSQSCSVCTQRNYTVVNTPRTIGVRAGAKF
ncbi:TonB-dependent receptor [Sphingomonas alpina]|uniref:TonB-dependent receptor n=1 Tax=Sphingomonas alpina TaxID=653931 RepID=A0A7H0LGC8_9SPHN|nr:TonB-dependent receptor [Sphingomonas alpina]QNQ08731.1 TonB-dependent receptor [Sphingomonas alpina]